MSRSNIGRTNIGATKRLGRLHDDISLLLEIEAAALGVKPTEMVWKLFCGRYGLEHLDRKPFDLKVPAALSADMQAEIEEECRKRGRPDLADRVAESLAGKDDARLIELSLYLDDDSEAAARQTQKTETRKTPRRQEAIA